MIIIERWSDIELRYKGKEDGNPFKDYEIHGIFKNSNEEKRIEGFYDGNGDYVIRFMPSYIGNYHYQVEGSFSGEVYEEMFEVVEAKKNNHGPVRVEDRIHLVYEDGTAYESIGTTCYAWLMQEEALQEQTIKTLEQTAFNKIRFCIFPKYYEFNLEEPVSYPYERGMQRGIQKELLDKRVLSDYHSGKEVKDIHDFDCLRFNIEYFKNFDKRIRQLRDLGIEADIILFHPYDKWGFSMMEPEVEALYLKYVAARFGAFRNVWWSMANEYDLIRHKTEKEWDKNAETIRMHDPYGHLCSIHNCLKFYDYHKDWITHCSMQRIDLYKSVELTDQYLEEYKKPIVWDEIAYEGNIELGWGNITAEEMVRRFWEAFLRGGHGGHGETYMHPEDVLWWSHGGTLHGDSYPRFQFLWNILQDTLGRFLKYVEGKFDEVVAIPYNEEKQGGWNQKYCNYEIHYYGFGQPLYRTFEFPEEDVYEIEIIDTWNMTIERVGSFSGYTRINLPGKQYIAIRLKKLL